jgi:probable HAF family extracellular repeat protein
MTAANLARFSATSMMTFLTRRRVFAQLSVVFSFALTTPAGAQTYSTFDVPGSISTTPLAINSQRVVAGSYLDASKNSHGFLRGADGTFTTFDAPPGGSGIEVLGISANGTVVGYYNNAAGFQRAFVRHPNGNAFTLTFPQAPGNFNAWATGINSFGVVVGWLQRLSPSSIQGFTRSSGGDIAPKLCTEPACRAPVPVSWCIRD